MKTKITVSIIATLFGIIVLSGCEETEAIKARVMKPDQPEATEVVASADKFQTAMTSSGMTSESAIELSDKYTKLYDNYIAEQQKYKELLKVNESKDKRLKECQDELERAKKELNEANNLLVEMRIELSNWKTDIIGFREEMRDADIAQLEALYKILKILGADVGND